MPNCTKCGHVMVKRTNGRSGKKFWGCKIFPKCRFTLEVEPVKKAGSQRGASSSGRWPGRPPNWGIQLVDDNGIVYADQPATMLDEDKGIVLCAEFNIQDAVTLVKSRAMRRGKLIGVNTLTPIVCVKHDIVKMRHSLVLETRKEKDSIMSMVEETCSNPKANVSKVKEDLMANFLLDKWYIIIKPSDAHTAAVVGDGHPSGKVMWMSCMDSYDQQVVKCRNGSKGLAYFKECHNYAFHIDWVKGPFDSKEAALRSKIKVTATREGDAEKDIVEYENGLVEFYDQAVCEKIEDGNLHLKDPKTGVVSVVKKHKLQHETRHNVLKKIRSRWGKKPKVKAVLRAPKIKNNDLVVGDGTRSMAFDASSGCVELSGNCAPGLGLIGHSDANGGDVHLSGGSATGGGRDGAVTIEGDTVTINGVNIEELASKVEKLGSPEKVLVEKAKTLDEQYNEDIDGIFKEYHNRNQRKVELNDRITRELSPEKKSGGWLYPVLAVGGSLAAIGWSTYTMCVLFM